MVLLAWLRQQLSTTGEHLWRDIFNRQFMQCKRQSSGNGCRVEEVKGMLCLAAFGGAGNAPRGSGFTLGPLGLMSFGWNGYR